MGLFIFFTHIGGVIENIIVQTMKLTPGLFESIRSDQHFLFTIPIITFFSGVSLLFGQSIAMFINKVNPRRFISMLCINGALYVLSIYIWAGAIWISSSALQLHLAFFDIARITFLGSIPFLFSFFILIPYFGVFISRALHTWSFIVVLIGSTYAFQIGILPALCIVGFGWIIMLTFNQLIDRPFLTFKTIQWHKHADTSMQALFKSFQHE